MSTKQETSSLNAFLDITNKLSDFYFDEGGDKESRPPFNCAEHSFHNIPTFSDLPDGMKSYFNPDRTLSSQFLRGLCDQYEPSQTTLALTNNSEDRDESDDSLRGNKNFDNELIQKNASDPATTSGDESTGGKNPNLDFQHSLNSYYLHEMLGEFGVKHGDRLICKYQDVPSMVAQKLLWLCRELGK